MLDALRRRLAEPAPGSSYSLGRLLAIFGGVLIVTLLAGLDQTIVATALPKITSDLHGLSTYSWVFTAYLLFSTISIPIFGKLGDIYGRRRLLLIAIVIFLIGSSLCAAAQTMWELAVFRAIQGVGAGGLTPLAVAVVAGIVAPRERGRYSGLWGLGSLVSAFSGPLVGGLIVDNASWRWIFLVNIPIGGVALLAIVVTAPKQLNRGEHTIDYLGAALLAAGAGLLLLAVTWGGGTYPWLSPQVAGAAGLGTLSMVLFAIVERRVPEPIIPLRLLTLPPVAAGSACWCLSTVCMFGALTFVPLFTQGVIGSSGTGSGVVLMPMLVASVVGSTVAGQVVARTGRFRTQALAGPLLLAVAMALLWQMDTSTSRFDVAVYMSLCGLGIGMMTGAFMVSALNAVAVDTVATATALLQFGRMTGTTLGAALFGVIVNQGLPKSLRAHQITNRLPSHTRVQLVHALGPAFLFGAAVSVLIFVIAWRFIRPVVLRTTLEDVREAQPAGRMA